MTFDQFTSSFSLVDSREEIFVLELGHVNAKITAWLEAVERAKSFLRFSSNTEEARVLVRDCVHGYVNMLPYVSIFFVVVSIWTAFRAPLAAIVFHATFVLANPCFIAICHLWWWYHFGSISDEDLTLVIKYLDQLAANSYNAVESAHNWTRRHYTL